jgi:pilus assembly protein Flp/PilA
VRVFSPLLPFENSFQKGNCHMLFLPEEKGQGLVEYAILIAFVAIVVVVVVRILGPKVGNVFSTVNSSF